MAGDWPGSEHPSPPGRGCRPSIDGRRVRGSRIGSISLLAGAADDRCLQTIVILTTLSPDQSDLSCGEKIFILGKKLPGKNVGHPIFIGVFNSYPSCQWKLKLAFSTVCSRPSGKIRRYVMYLPRRCMCGMNQAR